MSTCSRLFHADNIFAYHDNTKKQVIILADVTLNPAADDVHICPNPVAQPASREFIVAGTTEDGIQPTLAVVRRLSFSFFSDLQPKSVIVYSADDGVPVAHEIPVGSSPPASLAGEVASVSGASL